LGSQGGRACHGGRGEKALVGHASAVRRAFGWGPPTRAVGRSRQRSISRSARLGGTLQMGPLPRCCMQLSGSAAPSASPVASETPVLVVRQVPEGPVSDCAGQPMSDEPGFPLAVRRDHARGEEVDLGGLGRRSPLRDDLPVA
jgi:hypothetical protein